MSDDARTSAPARDALLIALGALYLVVHAVVDAFLEGGTSSGLAG